MSLAPHAEASFVADYAESNWLLTNINADGFVNAFVITGSGLSLTLTGGNNGSGAAGVTNFITDVTGTGMIQFHFDYSSLDLPTLDYAGYLWNNNFFPLADTDGESGNVAVPVTFGDTFGFRLGTADNQFEPGMLTVPDLIAPSNSVIANPEPNTGYVLLLITTVAGLGALLFRARATLGNRATPGKAIRRVLMLAIAGLFACVAHIEAQQINLGGGTNMTGRLVLTRTVNVLQQAQLVQTAVLAGKGPELPKFPNHRLYPPIVPHLSVAALPTMQSMGIASAVGNVGFMGLTHRDQRLANGGNQFSVEPPTQGVAVGEGYLLEGVQNAIQVYTLTGLPILPAVISTNQLFGIPPAIDRVTGVNGVYPTDLRVFYDRDIRRWFVLEWSQANDADGNPMPQSQMFIAVSQTPNPAGTYNIYTIDTTNSAHSGCPCIPDFPQIGADQYGFYISANEFNDSTSQFVDAIVFAISKTALANGSGSPTMSGYTLTMATGYEASLQPASTPPGASYITASGGVEYLISSKSRTDNDSNLALWALSNTISLNSTPNLQLIQVIIPALTYITPAFATQRPGPLPYGSTVGGVLAPIDGGDLRVLSLCYAGGRLYGTLQTQVTDEDGNILVGGAYFVISVAYRGGLVNGSILRQGYLLVRGQHLLRPVIAVNAQGSGAIAFSLVGPNYFPSAAFVPFSNFAPASTVLLTATGSLPEDGFTGYESPFVARWGDNSNAVINSDGSVWMAAEYIPDENAVPPAGFANWGTFVMHYNPVVMVQYR
jgi:hypothetical protein